MPTKTPRISALYVSLVGAWVTYDVARWTLFSSPRAADRSGLELALWIACVAATLAGTLASARIAIKANAGKGSLIVFSVSGLAIAIVGTLAFYIDLMMSAQAVFYHSPDANQTLAIARCGLAASIAVFLICFVILVRSIFARP